MKKNLRMIPVVLTLFFTFLQGILAIPPFENNLELKWNYNGIIAECKIIENDLFLTKINLLEGNKKIGLDIMKFDKEAGEVIFKKTVFEEDYSNEKYINFGSGFFKHHFGNSDIIINNSTVYVAIETGHNYEPKNFYKNFLWNIIAFDFDNEQIKWR